MRVEENSELSKARSDMQRGEKGIYGSQTAPG